MIRCLDIKAAGDLLRTTPPPLQNKSSETTTKAKRCLSSLDRALRRDGSVQLRQRLLRSGDNNLLILGPVSSHEDHGFKSHPRNHITHFEGISGVFLGSQRRFDTREARLAMR